MKTRYQCYSTLILAAALACATGCLRAADAKSTDVSALDTNVVRQVLQAMPATTIMTSNDVSTATKVRDIKTRLLPSRAVVATRGAPKDLGEAAQLLMRSVAMACPPGACVECDGIFFFSGGKSTRTETNFFSGFALKRGDLTLYTWEDRTPREQDQPDSP